MGSAPSKPPAKAKMAAVSRITVTPKLKQNDGTQQQPKPEETTSDTQKLLPDDRKEEEAREKEKSKTEAEDAARAAEDLRKKIQERQLQQRAALNKPPEKEDPETFHNRVLNKYKTNISGHLEKLGANPLDVQAQCDIINTSNNVFFEMRAYPDWIDKHRTKVCGFIHSKGKIIEAVCDSILDQARRFDIKTSSVCTAALLVIVNWSDHSVQLSKDICNKPGFLQFLYDTCDKYKDSPNDLKVKQLLTRLLMIIHNLAMRDSNVPALQELKFVPVLQPYLSFPNDTIRMTAILAMADIMTESESNLINANDAVMKFLLKIFDKSVNDKGHKASDGSGMIWSSLELAKGIGSVARNDGNKRLLVELGCLPSLLKLANSEDDEESKESLKSLWALAFNESNQDSMIKEPGLIKFIDDKNRSGNSEIKPTCYGILWTMRTKLLQSKEFKSIGERLTEKRAATARKARKSNPASKKLFSTVGGIMEKADLEQSEKEEKQAEEERGHVMISYQWGNQELLTTIRDRIRAQNHKVWMDIDDMEGSTLQAMADAIENAEIVVICMSRKYKDSPNCRAEAEYAHQLRKKVIPLIMERGYRPDGWLGMILGAKLFYDFSGKYPFESKIEGLLKEITMKIKGDQGSTAAASNPVTYDVVDGPSVEDKIVPVRQELMYAPSRPPPQKLCSVKNWSKNQVKDWLTKFQLNGQSTQKLTGKEVAFLQKIQTLAPDFYYITLKSDLQIKGLTEMANFEAAMDDLPDK